ncbi:alpha/beta hydrolase [Kribbella sancticallisti]|uniref:Alpha/beta hydrolase n=1 Tax=Kribbella sancticallisti TaxID=460087 RepID=A0ABN2EVR8_9ACTN
MSSSSTSPSGPEPSSQLSRYPLARRVLLSGAAAAATAVPLGSGLIQPAAAAGVPTAASGRTPPAPRGAGSVSGAPHLPAGFRDTFTSRYVDANGIRQHVVIGGDGPPLLLVHGWPQTWYAWRLIMPTLAKHFTVIAADQRGIGLSSKPADGYDSGTLADDLVALMDALGHQRFALYGTDVGFPIAYALAADHRERVARLVVSEAILPGVGNPLPLLVDPGRNERLWHIQFNRTAEVNERLVKGREDIYFGNEFHVAAAKPLPRYAVDYYIRMLRSDPHALRGSFGWYRALDVTIPQNEQRMTNRLTLPVLAIGGEFNTRDGIGITMKMTADDVQTLILPGSGHWVAEESPTELLAALAQFLAPYRRGA